MLLCSSCYMGVWVNLRNVIRGCTGVHFHDESSCTEVQLLKNKSPKLSCHIQESFKQFLKRFCAHVFCRAHTFHAVTCARATVCTCIRVGVFKSFMFVLVKSKDGPQLSGIWFLLHIWPCFMHKNWFSLMYYKPSLAHPHKGAHTCSFAFPHAHFIPSLCGRWLQ